KLVELLGGDGGAVVERGRHGDARRVQHELIELVGAGAAVRAELEVEADVARLGPGAVKHEIAVAPAFGREHEVPGEELVAEAAKRLELGERAPIAEAIAMAAMDHDRPVAGARDHEPDGGTALERCD